MPRSFFRDNLKGGGKKTAADSMEELRDRLLREEMDKASHDKDVVKTRIKAKAVHGDAGVNETKDLSSTVTERRVGASVRSDDAAQREDKKTAAAIINKLSGSEQRVPVHVVQNGNSLVGSVFVGCAGSDKAGNFYDDISVCRLLGIKRRIVAQARTMGSRGKNWECVGYHAGMSRDWVANKLLELKKPITDIGKISPIRTDDGIVSVKLIGTWPNCQKVTVERMADGVKEIASVRDSREMHLGDVFDCRRFGNSLSWVADINSCQY